MIFSTYAEVSLAYVGAIAISRVCYYFYGNFCSQKKFSYLVVAIFWRFCLVLSFVMESTIIDIIQLILHLWVYMVVRPIFA